MSNYDTSGQVVFYCDDDITFITQSKEYFANQRKKIRFYVRATGDNQFAGGTGRWLRIRKFVKDGDGYEIKVRIRNIPKYVHVSEKHHKYLEFAEGWPGLKPVSLQTIIGRYYANTRRTL
jgi:hypothetical protein